MRSTFSRIFFPAALMMLAALLLVGASFQILVKDYLVKQAFESLENDGAAISKLASAYYTEGSLSGKDFYINLDIASQISDADAVIFDANGTLVLCSDSPFSCEHQGWSIDREYVGKVLENGTARNTGMFSGLGSSIYF